MQFLLHGENGGRLDVEIVRYLYPHASEYWDANWLDARIRVQAGAFQGAVHAALHASELPPFLEELRKVGETLRGVAIFETMEEQLTLTVAGDGLGHILASGRLLDQAGSGNELLFHLTTDQTEVSKAVSQLAMLVTKFPVRGAV